MLRGVIGSDTLELDIRIDNARLISQVKVRIGSTAWRYRVRVTPGCEWVTVRSRTVRAGTVGDVQVGRE
jgi:hypothetical protein